MKKLFTLVAIVALGISTIGCAEKKAAAPPAAPSTGGDAPKADTPPAEPAAEEKK